MASMMIAGPCFANPTSTGRRTLINHGLFWLQVNEDCGQQNFEEAMLTPDADLGVHTASRGTRLNLDGIAVGEYVAHGVVQTCEPLIHPWGVYVREAPGLEQL